MSTGLRSGFATGWAKAAVAAVALGGVMAATVEPAAAFSGDPGGFRGGGFGGGFHGGGIGGNRLFIPHGGGFGGRGFGGYRGGFGPRFGGGYGRGFGGYGYRHRGYGFGGFGTGLLLGSALGYGLGGYGYGGYPYGGGYYGAGYDGGYDGYGGGCLRRVWGAYGPRWVNVCY